MYEADVIIVGSGLAALMTAYHLCEQKNVIVFTKTNKEASNSWLAQGGIAAAVHSDDHWSLHYEDTIRAGCEHNDEKAVHILVKEGQEAVQQLISCGFVFDSDEDGRLSLGREGAHRKKRILHAGGDATGKELVTFLLERLQDRIQLIEREEVTNLLVYNGRCIGVQTNKGTYRAQAVVIATGGIGQLYTWTSNAKTATGDGIALAYRAGAAVIDMEFVQFHPTMLYVNGKTVGLVSEAVRGEGAVLVTEDGRRVMEGVHPLQDLAPRDVVARAIYDEMMNGQSVYLDICMIANFSTRFPTIASLCERYQVDWRSGRIPVAPGAHFLMGGIAVNVDGETSLPRLYAVGEAACTGVHGANRLASNSLLEALVFSKRLAERLKAELPIDLPIVAERAERACEVILPTKQQIQQTMTELVGIVRTESKLKKAKQWFEQFSLDTLVSSSFQTEEERTIAHMLLVGWLIATSALRRKESRGAHYRFDYPYEREYWAKRRIVRTKEELVVQKGVFQ